MKEPTDGNSRIGNWYWGHRRPNADLEFIVLISSQLFAFKFSLSDDSSIVDDDVDAPEALLGGFEGFFDALLVPHVAHDGVDVGAELGSVGGNLDVADHHFGAGLQKPGRKLDANIFYLRKAFSTQWSFFGNVLLDL